MAPEFRLHEWTIEPFGNRLVHAGDEQEVRVEPKVMQVLAVLAERPGEVVTKDELFERVWGGRRLTDDVLTVTVSALRKALGDSARSPRFVQTVPGSGYRLIAPVAEPEAGERMSLLRVGAVLAALLVLLLGGLGWRRIEGAASAAVPSADVRDRLVEARYLLRQREPDGALRARELLEGVVADAPDFAAGHLALAEAHLLLAEMGPAREPLAAAREAAGAALALEASPDARALLAQVRFALDWDFAGAEQEFRAVLRADPENARAHLGLGSVLLTLGRSEEALAHVEEYGRLDPHAYPSPFRAFVLASLLRFDEATGELARLAANAPDDPNLLIFLARTHAAAGEAADCYRAYDAYYALTGAGDGVRSDFRARYAAEGLRGIHLFILGRLEERGAAGGRVSTIDLAAYHAFAGHTDEAFRHLERAHAERDLGLPFIAERPAFLALRDDPRFAELLERMSSG